MPNRETYRLTVAVPSSDGDPGGTRKLRALLKWMFRALNIRCDHVQSDKSDSASHVEHDER